MLSTASVAPIVCDALASVATNPDAAPDPRPLPDAEPKPVLGDVVNGKDGGRVKSRDTVTERPFGVHSTALSVCIVCVCVCVSECVHCV